jgi:hypothetical protein
MTRQHLFPSWPVKTVHDGRSSSMRILENLLNHLPRPALERLIAWKAAYPNIPLKYLPLPVRAEVKQILSSALRSAQHAPPPRPQPVVSPPAPPTNGHTNAHPTNGTPRPAPGRFVPNLSTVIGTDTTTERDIVITQEAKQQGCYVIGANGT